MACYLFIHTSNHFPSFGLPSLRKWQFSCVCYITKTSSHDVSLHCPFFHHRAACWQSALCPVSLLCTHHRVWIRCTCRRNATGTKAAALRCVAWASCTLRSLPSALCMNPRNFSFWKSLAGAFEHISRACNLPKGGTVAPPNHASHWVSSLLPRFYLRASPVCKTLGRCLVFVEQTLKPALQM